MKLRCEALKVEDLVDTGTGSDPQDPALTIKIGKQVKSTERFVFSCISHSNHKYVCM